MQFDSWSAFWQMGGYAFYVWLSFGVSIVALGWIAIDSHREHKKLLKAVVTEKARQQRVAKARAKNS